MCIFTFPTEVSNTRIYARESPRAGGRHQFLVYQMVAQASQDLAMILPLPVPTGTRESEVHFLAMDHWPQLFEHFNQLFPSLSMSLKFSLFAPFMKRAEGAYLRRVEVGDYEASFVPTLAHFDQLDPWYCLPPETWNQLPRYADYGFAVLQTQTRHPLRPSHGLRISTPRYGPTLLSHRAHPRRPGAFRSRLQTDLRPPGWKTGFWHPYDHPSICALEPHERPFLDLMRSLHRTRLTGVLPNEDTWLKL